MAIFEAFLERAGSLPDWAALYLAPALCLAAGILFFFFGGRKAYPFVAAALGAAGFFLVSCKGGPALPWLALYVLLALLVRLLLFVPFGRGKDRSEELYEKFHEPLEVPEEAEEPEGEESAMLAHAFELLDSLGACTLSAGDRLETDAIRRTLEGFRGRGLTAEEARSVNDCLATILKFTAKYKL